MMSDGNKSMIDVIEFLDYKALRKPQIFSSILLIVVADCFS